MKPTFNHHVSLQGPLFLADYARWWVLSWPSNRAGLMDFTAATCGDADACIGTEFCTTATFTTPTTTTITTCVPTPTCLGVYCKRGIFLVTDGSSLTRGQLTACPAVSLVTAARATAPQPNVARQITSGRAAERTMDRVSRTKIVVMGTSVWRASACGSEV